jgi:methyl-accepting chemotaxis protein
MRVGRVTADSSSKGPPTPNERSTDLKVVAAAAILVGLVAVAVALAATFVVALTSGANAVEGQARYSAAVDAAALHAKGMANNERGFLIDGDEAFITQLEGRAELVRAAFAAAAEAADETQRSTVAEAREGFERWLDTLGEEVAIYQAGDRDAAIEMSLGQTRTLRWAYEGWLTDAATLGANGFQGATASVAEASTVSLLVLIGYLVVAIAAAVAIALWVIRAILRPTYTLLRLLTDAEEGAKPDVVS